MGFEIGQEVEYRSFDFDWKRATIIRKANEFSYVLNDGEVEFERLVNVIRLIPDDGKQPVQYPPMRAMVGDKPLNTWQQVLADKPLATSQPHLYLLGKYDVWIDGDMNESTQPYLVMNMEMCDGQQKAYYRVFVITEGE